VSQWQRNCCRYSYRAGANHPFGANPDVGSRIGRGFRPLSQAGFRQNTEQRKKVFPDVSR
jgi:hypothetical protein